jgi:uncharacterized protein YndB with AHSA1/START domain
MAMKRFVRWFMGILIALVVVFAAGAYVLPGEAVVQRQILINVPPQKVWAIVGDMKRFNEYSPWAELDPAAKYTFGGPDKGVGQKMSWSSENANVGSGSQTVLEWVENQRLVNELDFGAMGKSTASLELSAVNGGTGVTWGFKMALLSPQDRWFALMFDRWIGSDYEKGLAKLKAIAEKS